MVDGAPTPSAFAPGPPPPKKPGIFDDLRIDFPAILAILAWSLFAIMLMASGLLKLPIDPSLASVLTNIVMLIVGFYFGSSTGSKRKDDAVLPPHA